MTGIWPAVSTPAVALVIVAGMVGGLITGAVSIGGPAIDRCDPFA